MKYIVEFMFIGFGMFVIGAFLGLKLSERVVRPSEFVVEEATIEYIQSGITRIENKGFNVGDTLVIIKK